MSWKEFKQVVKPAKKDKLGRKVEYYRFGPAPVLIVAPHIGGEKVQVKAEGKQVTFNMCEWGTDVLAAVAARDIKGGLLVSRIPRNRCDFARPPEKLGGGAIARLGHSQLEKAVKMVVHSEAKYRPLLEKFHRKINEVDPAFILTYHGMLNQKFDVLLGFGRRKQYIGGLKNSRRFKRDVLARLVEAELDLKVGVSYKKLTGESDYILNSHVKSPVMGGLVEFNKWGRAEESPTQDYRQLGIHIARTAKRWVTG